MEILDLKSNTPLSALPKGTVVALGNFDGVHIGHARLICTAVKKAGELNSASVVWTFKKNPHISDIHSLLTDNEEKCRIFKNSGIDYVVFEDFDKVKSLSPSDFVNYILSGLLDCRLAVCGFNFHFGYKGSGTSEDLKLLFKNVIVVPEVEAEGFCVSSTRIRALVESGDTEGANTLLGRPCSVFSPIVEGNHIGRKLGLPTINQSFPTETVIPKPGVYCSGVYVGNGYYYGVSDIGVKPTVGGGDVIIETHILGFDGDLYGKSARVCLYKRLRDEIKFDSLEKLKAAIENDIVCTKNYFQIKG